MLIFANQVTKVNRHSLVLRPKAECSWSGNQTRHAIKALVELSFRGLKWINKNSEN